MVLKRKSVKLKNEKSATLRQTERAEHTETKIKRSVHSKSSEHSVLPKTHPTVKQSPVKSYKPAREPQTMEELLIQTGYQLRGLKRGQLVEGTITEIGKHNMLIDIGAKTEGVILEKEFELSRDLITTLKVGDKIKLMVGMPENDRGQILLSLRGAAENYKWELFDKYLKDGELVEVRGLDVNKGGMIARAMDVYGFIPVSQFGRRWLGNLDKLYNKIFKVKIIEVDRTKNRLIFSEKAVSEAQALASQAQALKKVKVGDELAGIVSGVMPFGIFVRVDIEGTTDGKKTTPSETKTKLKTQKKLEKSSVNSKSSDYLVLQEKPTDETKLFLEGLVHISEISWEKVENLNKLYQVGDKVKVKVLGIDQDSARLNLSIKKLQADPWTQLAKKYLPEKKFKGKVTKLAAFGAFVSLEPGVEGLVHISKIPADFTIAVGDQVDVTVENIDLEHHRIALGLILAKKPVGYK